jgi:hypothetical protein
MSLQWAEALREESQKVSTPSNPCHDCGKEEKLLYSYVKKSEWMGFALCPLCLEQAMLQRTVTPVLRHARTASAETEGSAYDHKRPPSFRPLDLIEHRVESIVVPQRIVVRPPTPTLGRADLVEQPVNEPPARSFVPNRLAKAPECDPGRHRLRARCPAPSEATPAVHDDGGTSPRLHGRLIGSTSRPAGSRRPVHRSSPPACWCWRAG